MRNPMKLSDFARYRLITKWEFDTDPYDLNLDITNAEYLVNLKVQLPLTQCQFDALVSYYQGIGIDNFHCGPMLKILNTPPIDNDAVIAEMKKHVYVKGKRDSKLVMRREDEIKMWSGAF